MKNGTDKLVDRISSFYPKLKKDIRVAHLNQTPHEFVYKALKNSLFMSFGLTILFFFIASKAKLSLLLVPIAFAAFLIIFFNYSFLTLRGRIIKRQKEIDKEVLFAGQYLLIKLYSGKPLLNSLIETTKSYGVASKYMQEIVDDIDTGSTIEDALENAMTYSPSEKFRKILFHINNALRLGIDVTEPLSSVLDEITKEQEIEVKRYGKKLNSLVVFYMLAAIVVPSIGMTIFIVMSSFINFHITANHFLIMLAFMIIAEFFFLSVFRTIRPVVNL